MMNKELIETENIDFEGSKIFVSLAKEGKIRELVEHVYLKQNPYVNHAKFPERLARNALQFFFNENHVEALEQFFSTPFANNITKEQLIETVTTVVYTDNLQLYQIVQNKIPDLLTEKDRFNILLKSCEHGSFNLIKEIIKEHKNLTQKEKLLCFLSTLKSKKALNTFNFLETIFTDFLYQQNDDELIKIAIVQQQKEVIDYLMYDKKLRITKSLNLLSWVNNDFAKIVEDRKRYDSLHQKSLNLKNKIEEKLPEKIQEKKVKKNKI